MRVGFLKAISVCGSHIVRGQGKDSTGCYEGALIKHLRQGD